MSLNTQTDDSANGAPVPAFHDINKEIGARLRGLIAASGKPFSEITRESGIPPADLSSITRGNMGINRMQLEGVLHSIGATRESLASRLTPEASDFIADIFSEKERAETEGAHPYPGRDTKHDAERVIASNKRQDTSSRKRDRARARRTGEHAQPSGPEQRRPRWGEPTFDGELTFYSFEQCLGPEFRRADSKKQEISFGYFSSCEIEVTVWTTLDSSTGRARPLGSDAIRVVLFDKKAKRKIEEWSSNHNRVGDCLERLEGIVGHAVLRAKKRPRCLKCGSQMRISGKPESQFWGCPNYYTDKRCTGARSLSLGGKKRPAARKTEDAAPPS